MTSIYGLLVATSTSTQELGMTRIGIILGSTRPKPNDYLVEALGTLLNQVVAWSNALAPLQTAASPAA
jgi:hypothetical protein